MTEQDIRQTYVTAARSYYGCAEADGSHKKIIDIYNKHTPLARGYKVKYTEAWCATFVSAMAIKCGMTDIIPTECSCPQMVELFKKMGRWVENDAHVPSPGDIMLYDWQDDGKGDNVGSPDHIGIVVRVEDGVIRIIEGNLDNKVWHRDIAVNGKNIRGYGVPDFASKATEKDEKPVEVQKTIDEIVNEVIAGKWGNGAERKRRLTLAGYDWQTVQNAVDAKLKGEPKTHTVVKGDTLWGLAVKYLGNGFRYVDIMRLNNKEKAHIYVGEKLKIPNK